MRGNEKQQQINKDNLISKSNALSLRHLNRGLTLQQMQLFFYAIYQTQRKGTTAFKKSEFEQYFGVVRYGTVAAKEDVSKLMTLQISTEEYEENTFTYWNVFSKISYTKGLFQFSWTPDMLPHIIELKEKFLLLDLGIISNFASNFTWRLYEFVKAKHGYWNIQISREDLMGLFNVENSVAYIKSSASFKKRVLNTAIAEINRYTEYTIEYTEVKHGRRTIAYNLMWSKGKTVKLITAKQRDELELYMDTIIGDMIRVFGLDSERQQAALGILNDIHSVKQQVEQGLSETKFAQIRTHLKKQMAEYQKLFD